MGEIGTLTFRTGFHSHELRGLELPVEIRAGDMRLVARTLTTKQIEVNPGEYYITSRLPAGQELQGYAEVQAGESQVVQLHLDASDESPAESMEVQHFLRQPIQTYESTENLGKGAPRYLGAVGEVYRNEDVVASTSPSGDERFRQVDTSRAVSGPISVEVRWFAGNPLEATRLISQSTESVGPYDPYAVQIPVPVLLISEPVTCQVKQVALSSVNTRIPIWPDIAAPEITLVPEAPKASTYHVGIRLPHTTADLLTRYLRRDMFEEAGETVTSDSMSGEQLLRAKRSDPMAAVVGAYTLLRIGDLERLHEWTKNLMNWFDWLPDGAAIRGEHLARSGEHFGACQAFLKLSARGLPFFTEGLSYALERLRIYTQNNTRPNKLSSDDVMSAERLLNRLRAFAPYIDFDCTYVTYTGQDPSSPDE